MFKFSDKILTSALALVLVITTMPFMTGCNSSQALADVKTFEPVVINALTLTCLFVKSPLCTTGQATIQGDYNVVIKAWEDYNTAVANGTSTQAQWNYLNAVFTTFEQDSVSIFSLSAGINQTEVSAIVASAQVLLAAIEVVFPPSPVSSLRKPNTFASSLPANQSINSAWLSAWTKDYNEKVKSAKKLHPQVKLQTVHLHSWPVRYGTLGLEK